MTPERHQRMLLLLTAYVPDELEGYCLAEKMGEVIVTLDDLLQESQKETQALRD